MDFSETLIEKLTAHEWPGNVRELENLVERMIVLRHSPHLDVDDLHPDFGACASSRALEGTKDPVSLREAEKELILRALERSRGNKSKAARMLGVPRHVLLYRMKTHKIGAS
jgi:two-component system NtrC family response regulator